MHAWWSGRILQSASAGRPTNRSASTGVDRGTTTMPPPPLPLTGRLGKEGENETEAGGAAAADANGMCRRYPQPMVESLDEVSSLTDRSDADNAGHHGGWQRAVHRKLCVEDADAAWQVWTGLPRIVLLTDLWPPSMHLDADLR